MIKNVVDLEISGVIRIINAKSVKGTHIHRQICESWNGVEVGESL